MKVFVYWNLHRNLWSVKALEGPEKGRVIARMPFVRLSGVAPKVSQKGRERVLKEKRKNVHAGLVGELIEQNIGVCFSNDDRVSYNPYKSGNFYYCKNPEKIYSGSKYAVLNTWDSKPEVYVI